MLCALLALIMLLSFAIAEDSNVPVLYQFDDDTELVRDWANLLGLKTPLRNIVVRENYDYLTDILREYQPDFFCAYTKEQLPRNLLQAGLIEAFTPTEAMQREISEMASYVQIMFRNELIDCCIIEM